MGCAAAVGAHESGLRVIWVGATGCAHGTVEELWLRYGKFNPKEKSVRHYEINFNIQLEIED